MKRRLLLKKKIQTHFETKKTKNISRFHQIFNHFISMYAISIHQHFIQGFGAGTNRIINERFERFINIFFVYKIELYSKDTLR